MYVLDGICYPGDPPAPPYYPQVVGVRALQNHRLWTRFSNGEQRIYAMQHLLDGPVFQPLKDPEVFREVYIDYNVPTWLDGTVDIDPETIYEKGINPEEDHP